MKILADGTKVVWEPLAGSQTLALTCPANIIVYSGTRGPGKTDAQLMRFRRNVGQGYGRYWRGIIFDREYKNLDDLVSKSMRWFPEFKDGARFMSSKADYRWVWPTGEELLFRAIKKDTDYWGYHGQEFPFIGWNELTKYPSDSLFESMMSCNRSSFLPIEHPQYKGKDPNPYFLPELPLEVFVTTNPFGSGHNWVKKRFISTANPGKIVKKSINVFNPRTQQREDVVKTHVHLFGSYRENRYLSPQYVAELESITDPNKRRAWLFGDWDIVAGGMFDDVWDKDVHVIEPFDIPLNWRIDRSYDHGESRPFSVGWWAESDGSDVRLSNGQWMSTVKGDTFRIDEWYGWTGKPNQGLRLLSIDIATGIVEREILAGIHNRVVPGPADNSIWDVENGNSIAADMAKPVKLNGKRYKGVQWLRSDKAKGSRMAGWKQLRQFLKDALPQTRDTGLKDESGLPITVNVPREKPGMFIFNNCKMFAELFPVAPRDETNPDDIDCFVAGTMISTPTGQVPIETLQIGDLVNTPIGPRQLLKTGVAGVSPVMTIELSNGQKLRGTLDHKIYIENHGLLPLCKVLLGHRVLLEEGALWLKRKFIMGWLSEGIWMLKKALLRKNISHVVRDTLSCLEVHYCTELSGYLNEGKYHQALTSTTLTTTQQTTMFRTLNYVLKRIMQDTMPKEDLLTVGISQEFLMLGERANKDSQYLEKILLNAVKILPSENLRALIVAVLLQHNTPQQKYADQRNVSSPLVGLVIKKKAALSAVLQFMLNRILTKKSRPVVVTAAGNYVDEKVYYMTVEQAHLFYANGVLCTNTDSEDHICDEARYKALSTDTGMRGGRTRGM